MVTRFSEIFRENYDLAWKTLRRLGVPEASADDAAQEVFLVVARKLPAIEPGRERSFVYGTARRVAADHRRTLARTPRTHIAASISAVRTSVSPHTSGRATTAAIARMISSTGGMTGNSADNMPPYGRTRLPVAIRHC